MLFLPCYGGLLALGEEHCLHIGNLGLFCVGSYPTPTLVNWGERTVVLGWCSAVYRLKIHFMGVPGFEYSTGFSLVLHFTYRDLFPPA